MLNIKNIADNFIIKCACVYVWCVYMKYWWEATNLSSRSIIADNSARLGLKMVKEDSVRQAIFEIFTVCNCMKRILCGKCFNRLYDESKILRFSIFSMLCGKLFNMLWETLNSTKAFNFQIYCDNFVICE